MSSINWPHSIADLLATSWYDSQLLFVVLAAIAVFFLVYALAPRIARMFRPTPAKMLDSFYDQDPTSLDTMALLTNKDFVILNSLHLPTNPLYLSLLRYGIPAIGFLGMIALHYPLAVNLGLTLVVFGLVHNWLEGRWHGFRASLESDLPLLLSHLRAIIQVKTSTTQALEDSINRMPAGSALRLWGDYFLRKLRREGNKAYEDERQESSRISPSLGTVLYLLERQATTGGRFTTAFMASTNTINTTIRARNKALTRAMRVRSGVHGMLGFMAIGLAIMMATPDMRQGYQNPIAQIIVLVAFGVMGAGYYIMEQRLRMVLRSISPEV